MPGYGGVFPKKEILVVYQLRDKPLFHLITNTPLTRYLCEEDAFSPRACSGSAWCTSWVFAPVPSVSRGASAFIPPVYSIREQTKKQEAKRTSPLLPYFYYDQVAVLLGYRWSAKTPVPLTDTLDRHRRAGF